MAFNNTHITYTATDIANYLSGKLTPQQMHAIEKQALQDPFLADAIEGFANANANETAKYLSQIHQNIAPKQATSVSKVVSTPIAKNNKRFWYGIAASFILAIGLFTLLNNNNKLTTPNEIAAVVTNQPNEKQSINNNEIINNDSVAAETVKKSKTTVTQNIPSKKEAYIPPTNQSIASTKSKMIEVNEKPIYDRESAKDVTNNLANANQAATLPALNPSNSQNQKINRSENDAKESVANAPISNHSNAFLFNKAQNITGKIVNQSNEPVPYASVQINNSKQFATTNAQGVFNIQPTNFNDTNLTIQVNAVGYQNQLVNIAKDNSNIIKLNNDDKALNEVVVTNLGNKTAKKFVATAVTSSIKIDSTLVPQGGWAAYQKYLEKNNAYSTFVVDSTSNEFKFTNTHNPSQEVVLSFAIDDDGAPIKIKVERSLNKDAGNKAVEILKNGPKWITTSAKKKNKVSIVIK